MTSSRRLHDLFAVVLAGLVLWASLQLHAPFGLSWPLVAVLGLLLSGAPLAAYLRERRGNGGAVPPDQPDISPRNAGAVLILVVAVALALRVHTLLARPAWADEMWTLRNMYTSDWGELLRVAFDDYWPPLHYILLNAIARLADTSILWLRLPSLVFGTLAVALMYPLGLTLFNNRVVALAGTTLLAGMTSHVLYSQEARVYSLLVLLAIASALFFYRSYWERRISVGFIVCTTLLTYSHSFASWYFIAGECVYVLVASLIWRDREAFRKGFLAQLIVFLATLPLAAAFAYSRFAHQLAVPTTWSTGMPTAPGPVDVVSQYQGLAVRSWAGAAFFALLCLLAVAPLVARSRLERSEDSKKVLVFLICWTIVPIAFSLAVTSLSSLHTFGEIRYHITVLPGLCLLAVQGLMQIRYRSTVLAAGMLLVLLPAAELPRYYRDFRRAAIDEAAKIVKANGSPDEQVYVGGPFRAFSYYYRGFFPRIGSAQWDSLAAASAGLTTRYTMGRQKWGDTYAYEKLDPQVRYYMRNRAFIREEVARGGFRRPYWLVLNLPVDQEFLDDLEDAGVGCSNADMYHVFRLELRHCRSAP